MRNPSYTTADLPQQFLLALNFMVYVYNGVVDPRALNLADDLMHGELEGVKGISGANPIAMVRGYAHIRDMMLLMPTAQFLRENKVSRVMYESVGYLMSNNMYALGRLFNSMNDPQQVLAKMSRYIGRAGKDNELIGWDIFRDGGVMQSFGYWVEKNGIKINSIRQLTKRFISWARSHPRDFYSWDRYNENMTMKDWEKLFRAGVELMGSLYSAEEEWLIKGDRINIPASTVIYAIDLYQRKDVKKFAHDLAQYGIDYAELAQMGSIADKMQEVELFDYLIGVLRTKYKVVVVPYDKAKKTQERLVQRHGLL